jgi:hypothetical protein
MKMTPKQLNYIERTIITYTGSSFCAARLHSLATIFISKSSSLNRLLRKARPSDDDDEEEVKEGKVKNRKRDFPQYISLSHPFLHVSE